MSRFFFPELQGVEALAPHRLRTRWSTGEVLDVDISAILHSLPGRNDTVRLGLETLLSELPGLAGCIFLPGDQPLLRKESLEAMVRGFSALDEKERAILRLGFRAEDGTERLGSPVLFGSSYFGALCSLPEGKGGSVVRAVYAARQEELEDADTAEELERLRKLL